MNMSNMSGKNIQHTHTHTPQFVGGGGGGEEIQLPKISAYAPN